MENAWARGELQEFISLCTNWWSADAAMDEGMREQSLDEIQMKLPIIKEIVWRIDPVSSHALSMVDNTNVDDARAIALNALGRLDLMELRDRLGPTGPRLAGSELHDWVWGAAEQFWIAKHYGQSVLEAWKSINAHLQTKSGVTSMSDDKLVSSLLGDPRKGNVVKVHLPDGGNASWETRQRGALLLGQAVVAGIRNVLAHERVSVNESEALE